MKKHFAELQKRMSGPLLVLFGQASQSIATFSTSLIIGRWTGVSELGYYAIAYSFCFLTVCLCDALLATPYTYFHANIPAHRKSMLRAAILGSAGLALFLSMSSYTIFFAGTTSLANIVNALPPALLALALRDVLRRHLYIANKLSITFIGDISSSALQIGLVLILALTDQLTAATALLALAAATCASVVIFFTHAEVSRASPGPDRLTEWFGKYLTYGRWLALGTACHVASVQLYPWLAMTSGGPASAGSFAAGMALANLMNPLLIGLTNYFRPRFMEHYLNLTPEEFLRYTAKAAAYFITPTTAFVLLILLQSETLLAFTYGDEYRSAGTALIFLALGGLFIALAAPLQLALLAAHAPITNLLYHSSILLFIAFGSFLTWHFLTPLELSRIYFGANLAGFVILYLCFWMRIKTR